jgi:hypothetical protein
MRRKLYIHLCNYTEYRYYNDIASNNENNITATSHRFIISALANQAGILRA